MQRQIPPQPPPTAPHPVARSNEERYSSPRQQDPPSTAPHLVAKSIEERSPPPQQDILQSVGNDNETKKEVINSNVKEVVSISEEEKRVASATEEEKKEAAKLASKDKDTEAEDEEQGECGFCLFMKGGGCKDNFIAWEKCVEEAEKNKEDIVEKCFEVTGLLKKCMDAHADYYEPILRAEKAMEEEAEKELGKDSKANAEIAGGKDAGQEALSSSSSVIEKK